MHRVIFFTLVYLQMLSPRLKFSQTKFCLKRNNLRYCYSPLWQRGRKGRGVRIGQIFPCYQYGKMKSNWIFMFGLKIDSSEVYNITTKIKLIWSMISQPVIKVSIVFQSTIKHKYHIKTCHSIYWVTYIGYTVQHTTILCIVRDTDKL